MRKLIKLGVAVSVLLGVFFVGIGCAQLVKDSKVSNPATLTQGLASDMSVAPSQPTAGEAENLQVVEEQIVKDLKEDIRSMFKAWTASDMEGFRKQLELGYVGDVLEKKVAEAEEFVLEGAGADINQINYKQVKVVKVEGNTAVVTCDFDYSGYEYYQGERGAGFGPVEVKREYTLELRDTHWFVTGER